MFAQSVVEYGALSAMAAAAQRSFYSVQDWFSRQGATTWLVIGAVAVAMLVVARIRSSRS